MKTKRTILALILAIIMVITIAACAGAPDDEPEPTRTPRPTEEPDPTPTPTPESPDADADADGDADADADADTKPSVGTTTVAELGEVNDLRNHTEKDNAAPVGQWATYLDSNSETKEYVPHYIRVVKVIRDADEVQKAIDKYDEEVGWYDFSLGEDQARDMEFAVLEIEIYYPDDYAAGDLGIYKSAPSLSAEPIENASFRTDGGMIYIGVGSTYNLDINRNEDRIQPGETRTERFIFTVLKNYDESEYVFKMTWWDGALESEFIMYSYLSVD